MSPTRTIQKSNSDEIPLARRSSPIRSKILISKRNISFILISLLSLPFLFLSNFLSFRDFIIQSIPLSTFRDSRLLGHYPYPEALPKDLLTVYPGLKVHKDTFFALDKMRTAAALDGIRLVVLSGYRSIELQREIFYENKSARNQIAAERAKVSAPPGYSEHSTGYAIDLGDSTRRDTDFEVTFEETPAFKWLKANAAKYHFILSFPKDNSQNVSYEPWHWRFEGTVEALEQFKHLH